MILDRNIETERVQGWKMPDVELWWWGTVFTFFALLVLAFSLFLGWLTVAILGWWMLIGLAGMGVVSGIGWIVAFVIKNVWEDE